MNEEEVAEIITRGVYGIWSSKGCVSDGDKEACEIQCLRNCTDLDPEVKVIALRYGEKAMRILETDTLSRHNVAGKRYPYTFAWASQSCLFTDDRPPKSSYYIDSEGVKALVVVFAVICILVFILSLFI